MLAGYTGGKLIWFKEEEPELFAKMTRFICPKDYIRLKVCGELAIDASDASARAFSTPASASGPTISSLWPALTRPSSRT